MPGKAEKKRGGRPSEPCPGIQPCGFLTGHVIEVKAGPDVRGTAFGRVIEVKAGPETRGNEEQ